MTTKFRTIAGILAFIIMSSSICFAAASPNQISKPDTSAAINLTEQRDNQFHSLQKGEQRVFSLETRSQDYLVLDFNASKGRFDIIATQGTSRPLRTLLDDEGGTHSFQLIADKSGIIHIEVTAVASGTFSLHLQHQFAKEEQQSPQKQLISPTLQSLSRKLADDEAITGFWHDVEQRGTPLVEEGPNGQSVLTFLARDAIKNARVIGAPSGEHDWMEQLGQSGIWYRSYLVPDTAFQSYQIAKDIPELPLSRWQQRIALRARAMADPLNKSPWPAGLSDPYETMSTYCLAQAPCPRWNESEDFSAFANKKVEELTIASKLLNNERSIWIYRTEGFDEKSDDRTLLYVFDGARFLKRTRLHEKIERAVQDQKIPPVAIVFVDSLGFSIRSQELTANPLFGRFMVEELSVMVARHLGLSDEKDHVPASRTILAGASFGGLAATTIGLEHPHIFGNVISLSGSFWWSRQGAEASRSNHVSEWLISNSVQPVKFFLSAGLFEGNRGVGQDGILETNRHVRDILEAKSYSVIHREFAAGHDAFAWQSIMIHGLEALFGPQ